MRIITLAIMCLFLAGCGLSTPQNFGHKNKFTLSSIQKSNSANASLGSLVLDFPKSNIELDTYRIALLRDGSKRDYFAGARWADFLPVVVHSSMVESLQNSGYFSAVTAGHANFSADYQLQGDIKLFHADYTLSTPPTISIKVYFDLIDLRTLDVIQSFTVAKQHKAVASDLSSIHDSFNKAFSAAQKQALQKIVKAARRAQ